jgi:hypothetical protein
MKTESIEERLINNSIRLLWTMVCIGIVLLIGGLLLCYLGAKDSGSKFQFLGFSFSSGNVGLFVIVMGVVVIYLQKGLVQSLTDPKNIKVIGTHFQKLQIDVTKSHSEGSSIPQAILDDSKTTELTLESHKRALASAIAKIVITLLLLVFGIFLLNSGDISSQKIGLAIVATVVGYWLK